MIKWMKPRVLPADHRRSCSCQTPVGTTEHSACWRGSGPIGDEELGLLGALEEGPEEGWTQLVPRVDCGDVRGLRLLFRQCAADTNTSELRAFLSLSVAVADVFEHLYSCAFLASCFPSWGFKVSAADEASLGSLGSDLVHITSRKLDLSWRWRKLSQEPAAAGVRWLLRPAEPGVLQARHQLTAHESKKEAGGRRSGRGITDVLGLANALCGFGLRPIPSPKGAACRLFIYARMPSSGFLMRTVLGNLCLGLLQRISRDLHGQATRAAGGEDKVGTTARDEEATAGTADTWTQGALERRAQAADDADLATGKRAAAIADASAASSADLLGAAAQAAERPRPWGREGFEATSQPVAIGNASAGPAALPAVESVSCSTISLPPFVRGCPIAQPRRPQWRRSWTREPACRGSGPPGCALLSATAPR
mmetsp:Transcript_67265/g.186348  ORF Transcript_67265/g.186348 Transcript_67265/m.186348 type:complete len:424 (-) Transcript_67265:301-1572(-)